MTVLKKFFQATSLQLQLYLELKINIIVKMNEFNRVKYPNIILLAFNTEK